MTVFPRVVTRLRAAVLLPCAALLLPVVGGAGPAMSTLRPDRLPGPVGLLEVDLTGPGADDRLAGLQLDRLIVRPGFRARVLGWPGAEELLRGAGLPYRTVSEDWGAELARRHGVLPGRLGKTSTVAGANAGDAGSGWNVPPFGQGSLAGYWTLDEVHALLDSLAATDSLGIVGELDTLGYSVEGRPLIGLPVASDAQPLGTRPEVLFTALTHAREPEGLQAVLYTLLRLLEGYGSDPELTYLVDEREIWFVPVINPDGYLINQTIWESSASYGYWRKNLRDNNDSGGFDGDDGVDLNRNFGYQWGYDDDGSSPDPPSILYRGPAPFSEPETQALRDFCLDHAFLTANNYHTHYDILLYPWGYFAADTPDSAAYVLLGDAMTEKNRYAYGRTGQLLYAVNGDANDWMYAEDALKPATFAFASEVGNQNDGFWPPPSRILPLAEVNHRANVILAYAAGAYLTADSLRAEDEDGLIGIGGLTPLTLQVRNLGVGASTSGGITVTMASGHPDVTVLQDEATFPDLAPLEAARPVAGGPFVVDVGPSVVPGTALPLHLTFTDGAGYVGRDTLRSRMGEPVVVFADSGNGGLANWTPRGGWALESVDGDLAFSDSPGGDYPAYADAELELNHTLDLTGAVGAVLRLRTRWEIEGGYDFAVVEISRDGGGFWEALAGLHTAPGHGDSAYYGGSTQPLGVPGYEGSQRFWIEEELDLSAYLGEPSLLLRFRLTSDVGLQMDGLYLDDLTVLAYAPLDPLSARRETGPPARPVIRPAYPNPARGEANVLFSLPAAMPIRVSVFDVAGREVRVLAEGLSEAGEKLLRWDGRRADGRSAAAGAYYVRVGTPRGNAVTKILLLD